MKRLTRTRANFFFVRKKKITVAKYSPITILQNKILCDRTIGTS